MRSEVDYEENNKGVSGSDGGLEGSESEGLNGWMMSE